MSAGFTNFPCIINAVPKWVREIAQCVSADERFVVVEKIGGVNLSLIRHANGSTQVANRLRIVGDISSADFLGCQDVIASLAPNLEKIWLEASALFANKDDPLLTIQVFGELFGGDYPSMKRCRVPIRQPPPYYSPDYHFCAFDVWVVTKRRSGFFMDTSDAHHLLDCADFLREQIIFEGTLAECLQLSRDLKTQPSEMPTQLGLEPPRDVHSGDTLANVREGHIIKPVKTQFVANTSKRIILKDKSDTKPRVSIKIDDYANNANDSALLQTLLTRMTTTRRDDVLTKEGHCYQQSVADNMHSFYAGKIIKDLWEELAREEDAAFIEFTSLPLSQRLSINKCLLDAALLLLSP